MGKPWPKVVLTDITPGNPLSVCDRCGYIYKHQISGNRSGTGAIMTDRNSQIRVFSYLELRSDEINPAMLFFSPGSFKAFEPGALINKSQTRYFM
jgi:hypothetical protein